MSNRENSGRTPLMGDATTLWLGETTTSCVKIAKSQDSSESSSVENEDGLKEQLSTSPWCQTLKSDQGCARVFDIPQRPHKFQLIFPNYILRKSTYISKSRF